MAGAHLDYVGSDELNGDRPDGVSAGKPASALKCPQRRADALLRLQHALMEVSVAV